MQNLPEHLGGHMNRTHLDEGSLNHMIRILKIKSMLDIGCGPGGMVKLARGKGLDAYGIDGDFRVERPGVNPEWITIHDYETGPAPFDKNVDLVWSCEFVEHVYEKYLPNFMQDFQRGKFVIMTYAPPGKPGHHHVNCNTEDYWKGVFKEFGFQFDSNMTRQIREVTTMNVKNNKSVSKKAFVKNHGLCFVKL
jgi:SAM-dependent methyltransferase